MNIRLTGKNLAEVRPLLARFGLIESDAEPELVVTHGGDGALLGAEREFPGVPKLPLRDAGTAPLCPRHRAEIQLRRFAAGALSVSRLPKVAGRCGHCMLLGINDIFVHNRERVSALRYRVRIDGELYANEIVGDGVGLSSVHGSSAYYRSITHSVFRVGVGLAFSNSTEEVSHLVLDPSSRVEIEIVRGPAVVVADNCAEPIQVGNGGVVELFQSEEFATVHGLEDFMCPECRFLRHPNKYPFRVLPVNPQSGEFVK